MLLKTLQYAGDPVLQQRIIQFRMSVMLEVEKAPV